MWPRSPGMPSSIDRSLEPTSRQSMPGTAAIASAFSTALGVSIITVISVHLLVDRLGHLAERRRRVVELRSAPPTERWPRGG